MPYLGGVADGQRLGMKMKLPCNRTFAAPAKLATSRAINGNLLVRRGAGRQWNNKGALRMNFGMRVPGGVRGQQEGQGRAAFRGNPIQAARHAVASHGPGRRPAYRRNLSPLRPV